MEILKNRPIVLQFVNFGGEREKDNDDSFLSLSLSLSPCLFRFCVFNIVIILRNNNCSIFIRRNFKARIDQTLYNIYYS